jgi:hypothetical protein
LLLASLVFGGHERDDGLELRPSVRQRMLFYVSVDVDDFHDASRIHSVVVRDRNNNNRPNGVHLFVADTGKLEGGSNTHICLMISESNGLKSVNTNQWHAPTRLGPSRLASVSRLVMHANLIKRCFDVVLFFSEESVHILIGVCTVF